jgi:hypothetical protein
VELVAVGIDPHGDAVADVAGQQRPADTGLDLVGDEPAQRPGARDGVEPLEGDQLAGSARGDERWPVGEGGGSRIRLRTQTAGIYPPD